MLATINDNCTLSTGHFSSDTKLVSRLLKTIYSQSTHHIWMIAHIVCKMYAGNKTKCTIKQLNTHIYNGHTTQAACLLVQCYLNLLCPVCVHCSDNQKVWTVKAIQTPLQLL